jgi:DHA1 family bicyclomycin/chloramphenicol resistance-like MFS transporter
MAEQAGKAVSIVKERGSAQFLRFAIVLGFVSAVGPIAIDMYLPALPGIARDLRTDPNHVGLTLMGYFLGLTAGQPVYGPLSDRLGRRAPLLSGLAIYVIGSFVCVISGGIGILVLGRMLQGLGAGAGVTISAAIIRDLHKGREAIRLMAARTLVIGVSPILAPTIGAAIIAAGPWRNIFIAATVLGVFAMAGVGLIPETHPPGTRTRASPGKVLLSYLGLIGHSQFRNTLLAASFVQTALIGYIAGSPFVLQTIDHLTPTQYGLVFACNGIGYIGAAQATPHLVHWIRPAALIRRAILAQTLVGLVLVAEATFGSVSPIYILPALFAFQACTGLVSGPATVIALQSQGSLAGTAAALMMCAIVGFGAIGSALIALFADGTAFPMAGIILAGSACALLAAMFIDDEDLIEEVASPVNDQLIH